ncbi:hypothetical protein G7Y79_00010g029240 [Physcia stellaris]|nr:hypothetical protein G7Y79_00010g029240 [Physcia stellaris]
MSRWRRDLIRVSRHGDKRRPQTIRATESVENSEFAGEARVNSTFQVAESSEQAIPRADGGLVAWKFLFAAFMMEAIQWGFALSYGVFQNYYSVNEPFQGNRNIPVIGTLATGMFYLGAPVMTPLIRRWPQWQKQMIWIGWAMTILSLVAASFAKSVGFLIAFQGVTYSTGVTIMFFPVVSMLNEWFVEKRGLAFGIMCAATGLSGTGLPFILAALLDKYGYATTLRVFAVVLTILTGPCLPLLKGRLPPSHSDIDRKTNLSFLKRPLFYFFALSGFFQGLGFFYPLIYLPSYANALGYKSSVGALLLALVSLAQVFGQIGNGWLSDKRVSVQTLAFVLPSLTCIATLTLWGLGRSLPPLIIFSLLYGFFGGGYVALWPKMGQTLGNDPTIGFVTFGIFSFLKGVGNVITGPISAALLLKQANTKQYGLEKYEWVVAYCGICMFASSMVMAILLFSRFIKK